MMNRVGRWGLIAFTAYQGTRVLLSTNTIASRIGIPISDEKEASAGNKKPFNVPSNVYRVALTGGPCGGKSTALKDFSRELTKQGFDVYTVPEVPTILIQGGCEYPGVDGGQKLIDFETGLIDLQYQAEESFNKVASSTGKKSVVIYDRGLLDIPAYLPKKQWQGILEAREDYSEQIFRERYDLVIHMVSTAVDLTPVYEKQRSNNAARRETAKQASVLDAKMQECYRGVERHAIIDNSSDFKTKVARATQQVIELVSS